MASRLSVAVFMMIVLYAKHYLRDLPVHFFFEKLIVEMMIQYRIQVSLFLGNGENGHDVLYQDNHVD